MLRYHVLVGHERAERDDVSPGVPDFAGPASHVDGWTYHGGIRSGHERPRELCEEGGVYAGVVVEEQEVADRPIGCESRDADVVSSRESAVR